MPTFGATSNETLLAGGYPVYAPEDYGTIDGTNDEVQINLAIDAADDADPRGGVVYLGGEYTVGASIELKSHVQLIGPGGHGYADTNELDFAYAQEQDVRGAIKVAADLDVPVIRALDTVGVTIAGLRLWCDGMDVDFDDGLIRLDRAWRTIIDDCFIRSTETALRRGLYCFPTSGGSGAETLRVGRCRFQGCGIDLYWSNTVRIYDTEIAAATHGVYTDSGIGNTITNCHFYECAESALTFWDAKENTISDCHIENNPKDDIMVRAGWGNSIVNNTFRTSYISKDAATTYDHINVDAIDADYVVRQLAIIGNRFLVVDSEAPTPPRYAIDLQSTGASGRTSVVTCTGNLVRGTYGTSEFVKAANVTNYVGSGNFPTAIDA